jgi:hypothetical protein
MLREILWKWLGRPHQTEHTRIESAITSLEQEDKALEQRIQRLQSVVEARYELIHRDKSDAS